MSIKYSPQKGRVLRQIQHSGRPNLVKGPKRESIPIAINPNKNKVIHNVRGPDLQPLVEELKLRYPIESKTEEYKSHFTKINPLVSVTMTTYNEGKTLVEYALKSILDQTYKNLQIIVIADHSTDDTDKLMATVNDSRVYYKNLETRSLYPGNTIRETWLIAGTIPYNLALGMCEGDFVTHCDHDDAFTVDRIEKLVNFIQQEQCDLIHHPFFIGNPQTAKMSNDSNDLVCGKITTSAMFYHSWFKQIPADMNCWEIGQPGDWNRFSKFKEIGCIFKRYPESLTYKS